MPASLGALSHPKEGVQVPEEALLDLSEKKLYNAGGKSQRANRMAKGTVLILANLHC